MKAVFLCAGDGDRLKPLTIDTPKPLLMVNDKSILEYTVSQIPDSIDEIYFVIQERFNDQFKDFVNRVKLSIPYHFVYQDMNQKGTYMALLSVLEYLQYEEAFLVINGDDVFYKEDLTRLIDMPSPCYGLSPKKLDSRYRTCDIDESSHKIKSFRRIVPNEEGREVLCFSGAYTLNKDFFSYEPVFVGTEAGIPHTLFAHNNDVSYIILDNWVQINTLDEFNLAKTILK